MTELGEHVLSPMGASVEVHSPLTLVVVGVGTPVGKLLVLGRLL